MACSASARTFLMFFRPDQGRLMSAATLRSSLRVVKQNQVLGEYLAEPFLVTSDSYLWARQPLTEDTQRSRQKTTFRCERFVGGYGCRRCKALADACVARRLSIAGRCRCWLEISRAELRSVGTAMTANTLPHLPKCLHRCGSQTQACTFTQAGPSKDHSPINAFRAR